MLPFIIFVIPPLVIWWLKTTLFKPKKIYDIKDQVVLITGASSGLGEACAWKLAERGAKVLLCARNVEKLEQLKKNITNEHRNESVHEPRVIYLDLNDLESLPRTAETALQEYGHIDVLINNAGLSHRSSIAETSMDVHKQLMTVNYFGALLLTKCILPSMTERKKGHIVAVSSVQGKFAIPNRSAYTASKHACDAFFNCLRAEVAEDGINVTVASPGYIRTNFSINARTGDGQQYGALDPNTARGMEPGYVATEIINAVECGVEDLILADLKSNIAILLNTLCPSLFAKIMKSRAKRERIEKSKSD